MQLILTLLRSARIRGLIFLFLTWGLFFIVFYSRFIFLDNSGLWVGSQHAWSDWGGHIGMANIFATKSPHDWFRYHPLFASEKLTYTFLADMLCGLLMRAGFSLRAAFVSCSITFSLALIVGLYVIAVAVLRSAVSAFLAINLFFLSAGMGFLQFLRDFFRHPTWEVWFNPPTVTE